MTETFQNVACWFLGFIAATLLLLTVWQMTAKR